MNTAPVKIPGANGGGGAPVMRGRSVFDETTRGSGAQLQEVRLLMGTAPLLHDAQRAANPGIAMRGIQMGGGRPIQRVRAVPDRMLGQEKDAEAAVVEQSAIEKVIQRESPPRGLSPEEARAIAVALTPAIEASNQAVAGGVSCGNVDSFIVQEVRVLRDVISRFASDGAPDERLDVAAGDLLKIDAVLACQGIYEQVSSARKAQTTAIVIGGIVVGGIVLALIA